MDKVNSIFMNPQDIMWIHGCLIIYDAMPLNDFAEVMKQLGKLDFSLDVFASGNAASTAVAGTKEDLIILKKSAEFKEICRIKWKTAIDDAAHKDYYETLSPEIRGWLERGKHGASVWTLFNRTVGQSIKGFIDDDCELYAYPKDLQQFNRCKKLVDAIPSVREKFNQVATISNEWNIVVKNFNFFSDALNRLTDTARKMHHPAFEGEVFEAIDKDYQLKLSPDKAYQVGEEIILNLEVKEQSPSM